ncbi:uncharacterized protein CTHT_0068360 [Thermochaetoides thermophila DSM 1495]|uniref:J domain-containing protein n=1 Tax=Chaetomium thermophilum (strain DSM 1495 / CBS 144.50 / IMI 039719) TaxID=759272 RepID=G0SH18_CHATD|nr:hypothetical protein CTHT_0068360 [Thermochaetoides thermophila DSM 1495]EGS17507.1 hypothetical protein CTHT_0068360 [Thermochaetoides thermophila DSM 1495]
MTSTLPPDPWKALGVDRNADKAEIRAAYKKLVLKCHPDKVQDPALKAQKQDEFQRVQQAYELLNDDAEKAKYEQKLKLAELLQQRAAKMQQDVKNAPNSSVPRSAPKYSTCDFRTPDPSKYKPHPSPTNGKVYTHSSGAHTRSAEEMSRSYYDESDRQARRTASYEKPSKRDEEKREKEERKRRKEEEEIKDRVREKEREREREKERERDKEDREKEREREREKEKEKDKDREREKEKEREREKEKEKEKERERDREREKDKEKERDREREREREREKDREKEKTAKRNESGTRIGKGKDPGRGRKTAKPEKQRGRRPIRLERRNESRIQTRLTESEKKRSSTKKKHDEKDRDRERERERERERDRDRERRERDKSSSRRPKSDYPAEDTKYESTFEQAASYIATLSGSSPSRTFWSSQQTSSTAPHPNSANPVPACPTPPPPGADFEEESIQQAAARAAAGRRPSHESRSRDKIRYDTMDSRGIPILTKSHTVHTPIVESPPRVSRSGATSQDYMSSSYTKSSIPPLGRTQTWAPGSAGAASADYDYGVFDGPDYDSEEDRDREHNRRRRRGSSNRYAHPQYAYGGSPASTRSSRYDVIDGASHSTSGTYMGATFKVRESRKIRPEDISYAQHDPPSYYWPPTEGYHDGPYVEV